MSGTSTLADGRRRIRAWSAARRVLAIRLDRMGDVLMTTPAIRALREGQPGREITLLTSTPGAAIAPLIPEVDRVIAYDPPWMKATPRRDDSDLDLRFIQSLRAGRFDAAVIFTAYSQDPLPAALTCHLAGIPLRLAHCRENPYQLLTDWVADREPVDAVRHEVRRQLDLVTTIGCRTVDERISARTTPAARASVDRRLREAGIEARAPWVLIHPGASAPSRRYPPDGFEQVARLLSVVAGWRVVVAGGREDRSAADRIARAGQRGVSLAGCLDLEELAALIERAPLLVANNSGPVHLAAAVGTPVVDLYALTNPQHTPWGVPARVLYQDVPCRFCYRSVCPEGHQACLTSISPEQIAAAAIELVMERPDAERSHHPGAGLVADPPLAGDGDRSMAQSRGDDQDRQLEGAMSL